TYKLKGDVLEFTMKLPPPKQGHPTNVTIKKISAKELVLEFDRGRTGEFKRAADKQEESPQAKLLVGTWEVTRGLEDVPVGMTFEFGKNGGMQTWRGERDMVLSVDAYYKVKGDKIWYRVIPGVKPLSAPKDIAIKKITAEELVLELDKDKPVEFK